jgi:diguanylate cyclase (GGDEF)-like protein
MVDVDHFKAVNDTHGHGVGDQVLQRVGQMLMQTARESDIVCRYGGEEFVILLPYTGIDQAAEAAERLRISLETAKFPNLSITASLGVSERNLGASDPQGLLDEADKCLYVAKRNGRNQVVRWDEVPDDLELDELEIPRAKPAEDGNQTAIPFQAITALISALAYRDVATAEHSRRVADLCVATGEGLMSLSACYVLENAALLHDIGKIGVPDSILLKPGPLTEEEWEHMRRQERIGVEIIRASFDSRELVSIVANHQAWFGGTPHAPHLPKGEHIPLGARILSIVNAYDAMTSLQVYREPRMQEEAFAELRRCAGAQFDPVLVERFVSIAKVRMHFPAPEVSGVSQESALQFGLQIERLMAALDNQDIPGLHALAGRLQAMAEKHQVSEIADKASELAKRTQSKNEMTDVLLAANELIELCRSTQSSYVRVAGDV